MSRHRTALSLTSPHIFSPPARSLAVLISWALVIFCFLKTSNIASAADAPSRPNIIVILADDMGYGDAGCYNPDAKVPSPNVDRLAKEGLRFTDAHSGSAVCTPTRYGLLTGRYAWRTSLQRGVFYGYEPPLIAADRLTVSTLLKQHGYHTACIGKWHLGWDWPKPDPMADPDFTKPIAAGPITRGFDYYFGTHVPNQAPYVFIENDRTVGLPTGRKEKRDLSGGAGPMLPGWRYEEILPTITAKAVRYIDERAKDNAPFFLYFPLTTPHEPITPSARFQGKSGINDLADLMMETDWAVGEVLAALDRHQLTNKTLVYFKTDNGHAPYTGLKPLLDAGHKPSGPLRGYKAEIYEGGHRVPCIVRWPGVVKPATTCDATICHTHLLATTAELLGSSLKNEQGEDSVSILPLLKGETQSRPAVVHHSLSGQFAIREGKWKLIFPKPAAPNQGRLPPKAKTETDLPVDPPTFELYDLANDIAETRNLAAENPEVVNQLTKLLEKYVAEGRSTSGTSQRNDVTVDIWKSAQRPATKAKPR